jgi:endoglucanase
VTLSPRSAWSSSGNANYFAKINDPKNNWAVEMHQYLDSDGSGTSEQCVSSTIGAERLAAATQWLQANGVKGFLGELGAGSNGTLYQSHLLSTINDSYVNSF